MKILYVTDIHGNEKVYRNLLELGREKGAEALLIGGDISPGFDCSVQRRFIQKFLIPRISDFTESTAKPVFIIMGNDDCKGNMDLLEKADKKGMLHFVHQKAVAFRGIWFAGYSYINTTPFLMKDWERGEKLIAGDLEALSKRCDMKRSVCLFHAPPFATLLDVLYDGRHVGSLAIRDFIEKKQPLLCLHGHIHESMLMTASIADKIGKTVCINPGNRNIVKVDLRKPESMEIVIGEE